MALPEEATNSQAPKVSCNAIGDGFIVNFTGTLQVVSALQAA